MRLAVGRHNASRRSKPSVRPRQGCLRSDPGGRQHVESPGACVGLHRREERRLAGGILATMLDSAPGQRRPCGAPRRGRLQDAGDQGETMCAWRFHMPERCSAREPCCTAGRGLRGPTAASSAKTAASSSPTPSPPACCSTGRCPRRSDVTSRRRPAASAGRPSSGGAGQDRDPRARRRLRPRRRLPGARRSPDAPRARVRRRGGRSGARRRARADAATLGRRAAEPAR